jgi:hypothetical protein
VQHNLQHDVTNVILKEQTMPKTSKSSKPTTTATATPSNAEIVDLFSPVIVNSFERVADLQKQTLELAAEQTAEWLGAWKQAFSFLPVTPPAFVFDVASQAVQTVIDTQKSAIDLVVEQTKSAADITKVRAEAYGKIASGVTETIQKSVQRSVEAQKKVLDFAGEQNKAIFEGTKKQLGGAAGPATVVVDAFQRGTNAVIEAQKSVLNIASQPFLANAKN